MSREIELKVPLTAEQFAKIEAFILSKEEIPPLAVRGVSHVFKSDEYYSRYKTHEERIQNNELRVIRIRTVLYTDRSAERGCEKPMLAQLHDSTAGIPRKKSYFCIKRKTIENGVEFNSEHETFIENPDVLRAFFEASRYSKWFTKTKDALSCFVSLADFEAHLELEKVNGLPYAEIEYIKDGKTAAEVRAQLEAILRTLGIDPAKRDPRSWAEIVESE